MTIAEVEARLENADRPVALALHKDEHYKVLAIGFKKGMSLEPHTSKFPAKIVVLQGKLVYKTALATQTLEKYYEMAIPVMEPHWFEAQEDSLCLLMQGWDEGIVHTPAHNILGWDY
jgi:quercetin dioxygenase-like cupin family protein